MQAHADRPDLAELERRLLTGQFPFVPRYPRRPRLGQDSVPINNVRMSSIKLNRLGFGPFSRCG